MITILLTVFALWVVTYYLSQSRYAGVIMFVPHGWIMYRIWTSLKMLKEVSYDQHSLFVKEKDFEVQIPFYRVKEVKLISLDGVYKFTLHDADQFGEVVFCKPSMWYPFTYKKVDQELRDLQQSIEKVKQQYWEARQQNQAPGLPTMNI